MALFERSVDPSRVEYVMLTAFTVLPINVEFETTVFTERVEPISVEYVAWTVWRVKERRDEPVSVE